MKFIVASLFIAGIVIVSTSARAQVILTPDAAGEYTAKIVSNVPEEDDRLLRVCIFRVDANTPDALSEYACLVAASGRLPADGEAGGLPGLIYEIVFTPTIVPGEDQIFEARNIYLDAALGEQRSGPSSNSGRLPGGIGLPLFVVRAPSPLRM